jgi:Xaa-Pro aminopeptidase
VTSTDVAPSGAAERATELEAKLAVVRTALDRRQLGGVRLRGQDWFAWATCGGSNAVLLASERGVAEVLVTATGAWILTDAIEAARLRAEEIPDGFEIVASPWADLSDRDRFVRDAVDGRVAASDLPGAGERGLPGELIASKRQLEPGEIARYRDLGRSGAEALTETLSSVSPDATELDIAATGASALLRRGIEPALILVAGSRRLELYRHPRPTAERIGDRVGVVFCGRRHGLYANLTRFAYLRAPSARERRLAEGVALVEAAAFNASSPGTTLGEIFDAIAATYDRLGFHGAVLDHHQGGTTGYLSREQLATPGNPARINPTVALAWNPSLPGSKIEDTVLRSADELEVLTVDPAWPSMEVEGRSRPDLLVVS